MDCVIAGLTVALEAGGRTARQAEAYRTASRPGPPDLTISCDPEKVLAANPELGDPDTAEYMATGVLFARGLLNFGGFQLHASAVELEGRAWLFSGPPGIGKSTMARRWERLFGAAPLNDDKPALRRLDTGWTAFGTPWSGKDGLSRPAGAPLGALVFLRRGEDDQMKPLAPARALPLLLSQTVRTLGREDMDKLLALADRLLGEIPVWQLTCTDRDGAALLARETLCPAARGRP